ncbi:unnamed protein product, partial [Heterosigma akashiwo]
PDRDLHHLPAAQADQRVPAHAGWHLHLGDGWPSGVCRGGLRVVLCQLRQPFGGPPADGGLHQ